MKAPQGPTESREPRVLLLTADYRERQMLYATLTAAGIRAETCRDMSELCAEIGCGTAAAVIADDVLTVEAKTRLESILREQPAWSDLPLILLSRDPGRNAADWPASQQMDSIGNAALLEHPLSPRSLVSATRVALRSRQCQYALRDHLAEHEQVEHQLRATASSLGEQARGKTRTVRLLRDVATASNFAESVEEALSFAMAQVCRYTGWAFGHVFLPAADDAGILVPANASYERAPARFQAFRAATLRLRIARGTGLVGRVYASGQPEWMRGIDPESTPHRAWLGDDLGVKTVAAFPIMVGIEVVGVLEFFSDEVADPDPELLDAMTSIGTQLGRVIERNRLDHAVRESYRLIEKISETAPSMIRVFDEMKRRHVHVNERMVRFFGISTQEALQLGPEQIAAAIHPDDRVRFHQAKAKVRRQGRDRPVTWQVRMRNAIGQWRWVRTWSAVFSRNEEGDPTQILSMSIDVTTEVEAEEKLWQTERLRSIGTLAAGIAHEINNPLASVVMTAQLLRRKESDPKNQEMLENLIQDAKRCGRIVRSVQKFARREPSDRVALDLNTVVRAAEELSRSDMRRSGTQLRLELEEPLPLVTGDATELEQVVLNLITNAAHASEPGQEVRVRTLAGDGGVQLMVRDEGHGIAPDVKRHVFDPFFTTRGQQGGTGLGLSIAHGIVEDHGGTIEMESEVGRGTTVTVSLPVGSELPGGLGEWADD